MSNKHRELLISSGALNEGHYVYASGKHGAMFVNKTVGLVLAKHAIFHGAALADLLFFFEVQTLVAPELGAITLMDRVADELSKSLSGISAVIAEKIRDANGKPTGEFIIQRDQARFVKGKRVGIIEDVATTGDSLKKTRDAVLAVGGTVVAAAMLWNRGGVTSEDLGVPALFACVHERIQDYEESECPLCKEGIPINTDFGKGKEYLARKSAAA